MAKVASIQSSTFSQVVGLYAKTMKNGRLSIVIKSADRRKSCQLNDLNPTMLTRFDISGIEFIVRSEGKMRPIIEEVRKANIFINTGKRVNYPNNLWGEVWSLSPAQQSLLAEKEKANETSSQHQSEHRSESK